MLTRLTVLMTAALMMVFAAAASFAADEAAAKPEAPKVAAGTEHAKQPMGERMMKRFEAAKPALDDAQKTKLKELIAAAETKMGTAADGAAKREIMTQLFKDAEAVLTAEQLASLPKPTGRGGRGGHGEEGKGAPKDAPKAPEAK